MRYYLCRVAKGIGCIAGALHRSQKLHDPLFFLRTLDTQLVGETFARGRNVGQAELTALVKLSLDRKLCLFNPNSQIRRTLRQLAEESKAHRGDKVL